jgi:hypothetical protein
VELTRIESPATSARSVVDRRVDDADGATKGDARGREVSAWSRPNDSVEVALSHALYRAAEA